MPAIVRRVLAVVTAAAMAALLAATVAAAPASATFLTYLDGNEVWVSTLDGARKARLSTGEGDYIEVAAADNGRILGVQNEAGKLYQYARMRLWETNGQLISQGPLPARTSWATSYVAPLGLDLTSDGFFAVYGYSGFSGPGYTGFDQGHLAVRSDNKTLLADVSFLTLEQSGYTWPSAFGSRVVAAQGTTVVAQVPDGAGPYTRTWDGLVGTAAVAGSPSLRRTDVAATGTLAAVEFGFEPGDDKIAALSLSSVTAPVTVGASLDCFLPTVGEASNASWSQDGKSIAWKDSQGVKVAGAPTGTTEPCALSSPPVLISATGSYPSIGGSDLPQLAAPAPAPGPAPGPAPSAPSIGFTPPPKPTAKALGTGGLPLTVRVPAAGKVTVTATVAARVLGRKGKPVVIGTGTATPKAGGRVTVRLKLNAKGKRYRKRLKKGVVLTLRITQGGTTVTRTLRLR